MHTCMHIMSLSCSCTLGLNVFWMFDIFKMLKCRKLSFFDSLCILCVFDQYCSLYGQLLLNAYHVKLRKAYAKLVFTRKATAKLLVWNARGLLIHALAFKGHHGSANGQGHKWGFAGKSRWVGVVGSSASIWITLCATSILNPVELAWWAQVQAYELHSVQLPF